MTLIVPERQPEGLLASFASFETPAAMTEGLLAFWREGLLAQSQITGAVFDFWLTPFREVSAEAPFAAQEPVASPKLVRKTAAPVSPVAVAEPVAVVDAVMAAPIAAGINGAEEPDADTAAPELFAAPKGKADDLTRIKGIGPKLAGILNDTGVWHYSQIASWTAGEATWINGKIGFGGRVQREGWQAQARTLSAG